METSTLLQRRWKNLLDWLESHGFRAQNIPVECREMAYAGNGLFARNARVPGSLLIAVPPEVLMNKMTLKRLYPPDVRVDKTLTAVQLISMHLSIWRPRGDEDSADPFFGPYISMLPRDFGGHPLTWLVLSKLDNAGNLPGISLLKYLPPSVLAALHRLHTRFWDDWCKVQTFFKKTPSEAFPAQIPDSLETLDVVMDFLWAWLNVNTRCLYYRLKRVESDPDNLTMCPVLDFANHTQDQAHLMPVPSTSDIWNAAPVNPIGDGLKFVSADNMKIEESDEILLTYGLHSNKTLFVEYGFVNPMPKDVPSPGGEVDVQDLTDRYVFTNARFVEAVKVILTTGGYWGDWTLHSTPDGGQPSWRLITALRLWHLVIAAGSAAEDTIQPWQDVVAGKRYQISSENEQAWRKTVVFLCEMLIGRAEGAIRSDSAQDCGGEGWTRWMLGNIRSLWREELFVARAVKECVSRGDEF